MFKRHSSRCLLLLVFFGASAWGLWAQQPAASNGEGGAARPILGIADFRTPETAITTFVKPFAAVRAPGAAAYLGVAVEPNGEGKLAVSAVAADSPAARAGIKPGDVLLKVGEQAVASSEALRDLLRARSPGDQVRLLTAREGKNAELTATLTAVSRPANASGAANLLGADVAEVKDGQGVQIVQVAANSPAARAKLKEGEVILKLNEQDLTGPDRLRTLLAKLKPGETVTLTLLLAEKPVDLKVKLEDPIPTGGGRGPGGGVAAGFDMRAGNYWKKDKYRLAVILIDYPDVKHHAKNGAKAWNAALFSRNEYKQMPTGQPAYGSLADYYHEQSYGKLAVEGKAFEPIEVAKKRAEYGEGSARTALLTEALDKLLARDGKDALKDYDGICFIYAGGRMNVARGSLYWPHRSSVSHAGKRWPYFICAEGGERMGNISVYCHEFGHMLGLPDLYARPENPGSEGAGIWCAMSNQAGNGRPQHFSAWSKEKLGWIQPAVIDPTVPQKLILAPINDSPKECFKVLVRPDGSEYLLLENRRKKGFDASLPAEGLLIWRVLRNRPFLEESHGVDGPAGPRSFMNAVPFPSEANTAFTPSTTPSSRAQLGSGLPVHITNIRRLPDGRITFYIGYEYD
jgi:M6 family metalloprotease-like protein